MKGSAISVRIADFLKEYPPFNFLEIASLRELASNGKVKFHEDGEIVFSQGQPRSQWLFVIQQGQVRILEEEESGETLIDIRGPGDMLGLQGIRSDEPYLHTCRTETETILYCLPRERFVKFAEKSVRARRYLAAYFSLNPAYQWHSYFSEDEVPAGEDGPITLRKGGLWEVEPPQTVARASLVTVSPETPVREVASKLKSKRIDCIVVVDENGRPLGKLTDGHLRDRIVDGPVYPDAPAGELMSPVLQTCHPGENIGDMLVKLTRYGTNFLVVTEDGSSQSPAVGLIAERNLFLQYGRFPSVIGEAIGSAPDVLSLRLLRDRLEALILEFLDSRRSLIWLMEMVGVLNRRLNRRIIELTLAAMETEGLGTPPVPFCWLMMGSGGRNELLIRSAVYHALVYEDPSSDQAQQVTVFFRKLANRVGQAIRLCGFLESPQNVLAHQPGWCLPLSAMKNKFSAFVRAPVTSHVYASRDAFDFQPVYEDGCFLADKLSAHINAELAANPDFIRHMASDSLLNQPPKTIFSGYVVDQEGIRRDELAIKLHALLPLVDVARVLTLESGTHQPTETFKRLELASGRQADTRLKDLLHEASEGFLVAQFARISQGLRSGSDGAVIHPKELDPETRTLLITTFRTILELLEATAERFELSWHE